MPSKTYQNIHSHNSGMGRGKDDGDGGGGYGLSVSCRRVVLEPFGPSSEKPRDANRDTAMATR
jgi:hypothetical protein